LPPERDISVGNPWEEAENPLAMVSGCYHRSWAVVIGINDYQLVEPLSHARADAEAVLEVLPELGFPPGNTFVLLDGQATRQNILDLLGGELVNKAGPNDRVLFFFAGHGRDHRAFFGRRLGFIIPVDGNPRQIGARCISMDLVQTLSDLISAKHILYLMDCCYSGLAATRAVGLAPTHHSYLVEVISRPVRQIITAGRSDQRVIEEGGQGVFTRVLVRGLRGDADLEGRGFITAADLGNYLKTRVYEESRGQQQPLFRYLKGEGEFIFVLPQRRRMPVADPWAAGSLAPPPQPVSAPPLEDLEELQKGLERDVEKCVEALKLRNSSLPYLREAYRRRLPVWRHAADLGWPEGQWLLGRCFEEGLGVRKDEVKAAKLHRKAAEQGFAPAQVSLAICYEEGGGLAQDQREAVKWYRKAAEQGYSHGELNLGLCYYLGEGVSRNIGEAVKWLRKAAEQGQVKAQFVLGLCFQEGGTRWHSVEALRWFRKAAEKGDSSAQFELAARYAAGNGVAQDKVEAAKWFRKAAEQGHEDAQFNLALCYAAGEGVYQDKVEAAKWFRKAAEKGHAAAQFRLAVCYELGEGVTQDKTEAARWLRKAAEQGETEAQFKLGVCYYDGEGVTQDKAKAAKWFREAAEKGHAGAQCVLGVCYEVGEGVKRDHDEALRWFRKAAEQGDAEAQYKLGVCYYDGVGVERDRSEAIKWFGKAARQGHMEARSALVVVGKPKKGMCFITSAVTAALGLPDDCHLLRTLRHFRDTFMMAHPARRREVEIYYSIAPQVVRAINASPDPLSVYADLCRRFIAPAVDAITRGEGPRAHALYRQMVVELAARFSVPGAAHILDAASASPAPR